MAVPMRLDWPVGALEYRARPALPAGWYVAVGFDQEYQLDGRVQVHPGIDLNRVTGGDSDLGEPVYATADGVVTASAAYRVWGNIVLLRHAMPDGSDVWSQYAHLDRRDVQLGQRVPRGWQIGTIGKGDGGRYSAHLHFELRARNLAASYWPGSGHGIVRSAYLDPMQLLGRGAAEDAPTPSDEPLELRLRAWADRAQVVQPNDEAALWRTLRADGFFPISDEDDVAGHRAQLARSLSTAEERIYFVREDDWGNVLWITR